MFKSVKTPIILAVITVLAAGTGAADTDSTFVGWRKSLTTDVTITQTGYSDSWVGGEAGSVNWVGNLNGLAERQLKDWFNFKSTLKLSFGQTKTQETDSLGNKEWSDWRKSTDLIDWENVGLFTLHKYVDPYIAFRLETQFFDGRVPNKKLYLSPLRLTESAGIARKFYRKNEDFVMSRLGLGYRQTFTSTIVDPVTLATASSSVTDGGIESVTDASLKFHENIQYTGKLTLFKALFFSESDAVAGTEYEDYWKAVDVNLENILSASVTKIVTVNLYTQLLYDKEISKKGRFKETVAIGFVFKLM